MDNVTLRERYLSLVAGKALTQEQTLEVVEALIDLRNTVKEVVLELEQHDYDCPGRGVGRQVDTLTEAIE